MHRIITGELQDSRIIRTRFERDLGVEAFEKAWDELVGNINIFKLRMYDNENFEGQPIRVYQYNYHEWLRK